MKITCTNAQKFKDYELTITKEMENNAINESILIHQHDCGISPNMTVPNHPKIKNF